MTARPEIQPLSRSEARQPIRSRRVTRFGPGLVMLATLGLASAMAIATYIPVGVTPANAPPDQFSAERALPHLQTIARQPHPVGSAEDAAVGDYLVQQLSNLGVQPVTQRGTYFNPASADAAIVRNVLVRLSGTTSSRAVLVVAHYDSVESSPGTGDNGMAVASMLETIRALQSGPRLRNDAIFLFDDGEEFGCCSGSRVFIQQHPWARDVAVVFDFDGDGPVGRSTLLWTTAQNGWLLNELANARTGAVAQPIDNGAKRAEFGNDLHAFAAAGYRGAHFDIIGGKTYYHTQRDSLTNLDLASLQNQGDVMLQLVRHFGNIPIEPTTAEDATPLTVLGSWFVSYPFAWTIPLALLAVVCAMVVIGMGIGRGRLRFSRLGGAAGIVAALGLGAALAGHLGWQALLGIHAEAQVFAERDFYGQPWFVGGVYLITLALVLVVWPRLAELFGDLPVAAAGLAALALVTTALAIVQPWIAYLTLIPALLGAAALAYLLVVDNITRQRRRSVVVLAVLSVPVAAFGATGLYVALVNGVQGSPALQIVLLIALLAVLAPQVVLATTIARRWLPGLAGVAAVALFSVGVSTSGVTPSQPLPDSLGYILNTTSGQAFWVTTDQHLDGWTSQLIAQPSPRTLDELVGSGGSFELLTSPAPPVGLQPPTLEVRARQAEGDVQTFSTHLTSNRGAWRAILYAGPGVEMIAAGVGDAPMAPLQNQRSLTIAGLPADGVDVSVSVRSSGPISFTIVDQTLGLPDLPDIPVRPPTFMAAAWPDAVRGYPTFVGARVELAGTE